MVEFDGETLTVGASPGNQVCVAGDGIAEFHLRFERANDLVYAVDCGSEAGTFVDGKPVKRFVLGHRALVQIGDLEILYLEEVGSQLPVLAQPTSLQRPESQSELAVRGVACLKCGRPLEDGETTCSKCGMIQPRNLAGAFGPTDLYVPPTQVPFARGAGILPMLSFFFGLFGPLILGIGWLLAVIFGFISLSLIRQRGGFQRDRRYAMLGISFGFAWVAILLAAGVWYTDYRRGQKQQFQIQTLIKQNESDVTYLLREIAVVEEFLRACQAVPDESAGSAYADLEQLQGLPNPFVPADNLLRENAGYLFTVKAHGGIGFIASAVPLRYGQTGLKTFAIDQTGVLCGADIGGRQPWEYSAQLPELDMGRSALRDARERIARELLVEARRLAAEAKFARSQFILRELQKNEYVMTETAKNFESVAEGVEQLVMNAQAREAMDQVRPLLAENQRTQALPLLKKILVDYPRATLVEEVKGQVTAIEAQMTAERNQLALTKWAEVVKLDQEGQSDAALAGYRAFAAQFADTAAAKANQGTLQAAIARIEEAQAGALFSNLGALDVRTNATQVLQITVQLQGGYPNTAVVKNNLTMLQGLQQQAQSYAYADEGVQLQALQQYLDATDRFDKAIALNPSLMKNLGPRLEDCYYQAGEAYFRTNKFVEAAAAYEKFLRVTSSPEKLSRDRLKQIYLSLGELNFLNKNYTNSVEYLRKGVEFFGNDPKYYRMYGESLMRQKKYLEALGPFQSLVTLARDDPHARFERALCLFGTLQELQTNIVKTLEKAAAAKEVIAAGEQRQSSWVEFVLPGQIRDEKLQDAQIEVIREKQFELRLRDTTERLKAYDAQSAEAAIIREAVRLVNDVQASATELTKLTRDARSDISENKLNQARNQLLSVFSTQQDYFDKIIAEKIVTKQELLGQLDRMKLVLDTGANDLQVASSVEAYRAATTEMNEFLRKKQSLFSAGYADLKPAIEAEIKVLEEARELTRLAVSKFKGWAIGWDLNDRIEKFFMASFKDMADKKNSGEAKLKESLAISVPFEKHIGA